MTESTEATITEAQATEIRGIPAKERSEEQKAALKAFARQEKAAAKAAKKAALIAFRSDASVPADKLNGDGLLLDANVNSYGFDDSKHVALKQADFASEDIYMVFRAGEVRAKGEALIAKANKMLEDAKTLVSAGSPEQRKALKKAKKLIDSLSSIKAALAKDGIDFEALMATAS